MYDTEIIGLFNEGIYTYANGYYEKSLEYCLLAANKAIDKNCIDLILQIGTLIFKIFYILDKDEEMILYCQRMSDFFSKTNRKDLEIGLLIDFSTNYEKRKQYTKAIDILNQALKIKANATIVTVLL